MHYLISINWDSLEMVLHYIILCYMCSVMLQMCSIDLHLLSWLPSISHPSTPLLMNSPSNDLLPCPKELCIILIMQLKFPQFDCMKQPCFCEFKRSNFPLGLIFRPCNGAHPTEEELLKTSEEITGRKVIITLCLRMCKMPPYFFPNALLLPSFRMIEWSRAACSEWELSCSAN